ncbi:MAG: lysylphosphatidylglycerol synthase transmembrane domain-containing protein [Anaerolineae bacterium]
MFKTKQFWIGLAAIVISLYFAFQGIKFDELAQALTHINLFFAIPALVVFWLSFGSRVWRWQLLHTPYHVRWSKVLAMLSIGYFLSNITPLRAGDVVRPALLARSEGVPVARSLSSVMVERLMDMVTVVLFLIILLPIIPQIPDDARKWGAVLGGAGVVALIAFALISLNRERAVKLLKRLTAPVKFLQRDSIWHIIESLIDGFGVLHSWRPLVGVIVWSLIVWFFAALLNWVVMLAMGIPLGFDAAALVLVATSLGVTVVPTPGQVGVFDYVAQQALVQVYKIDPAKALAFALVIHAYVYLWLMVLGVFFMWREGLSYGQLQKVRMGADTPSPAPTDA